MLSWQSDGGRLPGGGDTTLEFEKCYSFNKYLSYTYLGHSDVFTRLMEEEIVCLGVWNVNMPGKTKRLKLSGIKISEGWE